ncbi:zinc finger, CCHC-type containing protein, partial [Tanacetum coccineum]
LGHVHFKRMQDMSKGGLIPAFDMDTEKWNKKYFVTFIDDASKICYVYLLHTKDEALDKFKVFKTEVELQQGSLIKRFRTDRGGKAIIRLADPKLKTLGERGIECIFVGYAEHSKAFRFFFIKPNESVSINSIIESKEAIFDENKFSLVPRPSQRSLKDGTEDIDGLVVLEEVTIEVVQQLELELRKNKRNRTPKNFGPEFQLYLIEGTGDEVSDQHSYYFNVEDGPKTFDEAMKSQDGFKQKSWIDYFDNYAPVARISTIRLLIVMASIHNLSIHQMDVKTAFLNGELEEEVYMNQPQGFIMLGNKNKVSNHLGTRWIFKRKLKVDGTIEKFNARLVIQGFRRKSRIDYFDTYALVARISTIRLLIAMTSIHNLIIHQMDVKIAFLNGELDEEVLHEDMWEADGYPGYSYNSYETREKLMPNNGQVISST